MRVTLLTKGREYRKLEPELMGLTNKRKKKCFAPTPWSGAPANFKVWGNLDSTACSSLQAFAVSRLSWVWCHILCKIHNQNIKLLMNWFVKWLKFAESVLLSHARSQWIHNTYKMKRHHRIQFQVIISKLVLSPKVWPCSCIVHFQDLKMSLEGTSQIKEIKPRLKVA